jgi:hypothetical protein
VLIIILTGLFILIISYGIVYVKKTNKNIKSLNQLYDNFYNVEMDTNQNKNKMHKSQTYDVNVIHPSQSYTNQTFRNNAEVYENAD